MPKIDAYRTEKITLPSSKENDEAYVTLRKDFVIGDREILIDEEMNDTEKAIKILARIIVDWNFTIDGTPHTQKLPITEENVNKIELQDFKFLGEWVGQNMQSAAGGLTSDEKKVSSELSPATTPPAS